MKRVLLLMSLSIGALVNAQTITIDDTLSIGDNLSYYTADSNATNYDAIVGTGVTWDYSTLAGYNIPANPNNIIDASTGAFAAQYPTAVKTEEFQNGVHTYFRYVGNELIVDGFVFQESSNDFVIKYDDDPLIGLQFPVNQGDSYTDPIEGEAFVLSQAIDLTGNATISADGSGTLLLAGNTYTNVLRVKTEEITNGTTPPPLSQPMTVTRTVYAYYDIANENMPIFIHGTVDADIGALGTFGFTSVYSVDPLIGYVGVNENEADNELIVYPNPATDIVTINVPSGTEKLTIFNVTGQVVNTYNNPQKVEEINVSNFETGVYFVQIQNGDAILTKKLIVK